MKRNSFISIAVLVFVGLVIGTDAYADRGGRNDGGHGSSHGYNGGHGNHRGHGNYRGHGNHRGYRYGHGHHGGDDVDVYLGIWPGYYGVAPYAYYPTYPYYAYPRTVVTVPAEPKIYIERSQETAPSEPASNYWYYCSEAKGYYPYVKQCPGGWQKVPPQPATP